MLNSRQIATEMDRMKSLTAEDQDRRTGQRTHSDQVLSLAAYLRPQERFLIEQVFEHGLRLSDIAGQLGKCRSTVQYHVKQLLRRMGSPLFRFMVVHNDTLNATLKRTGSKVILQGYSLRDAAASLGLSLHTVRCHIQSIQALSRA